jgi:NAD(P)-dependent dehydrogenase (short-subunit alcohol dehydrogenase family)
MATAAPMLEGKVVLVAGVGQGLGREIVEAAVREGALVVLGARSTDVLEEVAKAADPSGQATLPLRLDVTDRQSCADFVAAASDKFGPIGALINLAALDSVFGGVTNADWDAWHQMFEVNVFGSLYMVEACLPHFAERNAAVVFVGSQTMYDPPPRLLQAGYAASKSAVVGAMRHLTIELGKNHIRLNNVAPGWMWGPPVEGYVKYKASKSELSEEAVLAELTSTLPLGEMATDGDVAEAVIFLASDRAHGITGQSLLVNAGEFMH